MQQMLPKEFYTYMGKNASGEAVRGKIQAADATEAKERLKRMGISLEKFGEDVTTPDVPYQLAADPSKVFGSGKAAESPKASQSVPAVPQPPTQPSPPTKAPMTNPPAPPAPPPAPDSQTRLFETVEAMSKARVQATVKRRKQKFIFGEMPFVSEEVNKLIEKADGTVIHMAMQTDAQGKLKMAIVMEYDAQVKETR